MTTQLEKLAIEAVALAGGPHPCQSLGHKWKFVGGRTAGCSDDLDECDCSVPVHECEICGDCDYGENEEADEVRQECRDLRN